MANQTATRPVGRAGHTENHTANQTGDDASGSQAGPALDPSAPTENHTANQTGDASGSQAAPASDSSPPTDNQNQTGDAVSSLSQPAQDPVVQTENQTILGLHAVMESLGDQADLAGTVHGLTNDGETVGLGKIGGDNLLTDTAQEPGDILNGTSPVADAANLITDAGHDVSATGGLVQGIGSDLSNPNVLQDASNGLTGATLGSPDGSPMVSVGAGPSGGSPILDAGVLTTPDNGAPISVAAGNGPNLADIQALDGGGDHLVTGNAGAAGGTPLADAGILHRRIRNRRSPPMSAADPTSPTPACSETATRCRTRPAWPKARSAPTAPAII